MAIDAVIERVRQVPEGLRLELAPRWQSEVGHDSCAGQPVMTIVGERRYDPPVGAVIWGGSDHCEIIEEHEEREITTRYRRLSATKMEQAS